MLEPTKQNCGGLANRISQASRLLLALGRSRRSLMCKETPIHASGRARNIDSFYYDGSLIRVPAHLSSSWIANEDIVSPCPDKMTGPRKDLRCLLTAELLLRLVSRVRVVVTSPRITVPGRHWTRLSSRYQAPPNQHVISSALLGNEAWHQYQRPCP